MLRQIFYSGIGRPIRKFLFLLLQFQKVMLKVTSRVFDKYVKLLSILCETHDPKWFRDSPYEDLQKYYRELSNRVSRLSYQPKISVILPVYRVDPEILRETLATVAMQCYPHWELCAVDDASGDERLTALLQEFAAQHPGQVRFDVNAENLHISATSNRCLELATGDYLALLDHDDRLAPNALAEMVRYINLRDQPDILYSDERVIHPDGRATHLVFCKPAWSPFLHLACNYTTHLTLYRTSLIRGLGGFRVGYEGSQDHDLMLRAVETTERPVVHVPFCLYQWRALETSTAKSAESKPYAAIAGVRAVTEACQRRGRPAEVEWEPEHFHYRVRFELPPTPPKVSILIPSRDQGSMLKDCLDSIFQQSTYKNFEVIVIDNGATEPEALSVLRRFTKEYPDQFHVERADGPFNFAGLNNRGARIAQGEYFILLNNDIVIRTPEWIEEMLRLAQFPEVGAVGCKLVYPNGKIQHAGIELEDRKVANHSFKLLPAENSVYNNFTKTVHEVAAITGACLMISAEKYHEVGGLEEIHVPNGYGDVDFCLRLAERGYTHVFTPYATLIHDESQTRGRAIETFERHWMIQKWGGQLMNDPYLNFNLKRDTSFQLDVEFPYLDPTGKDFKELLAEHFQAQEQAAASAKRAA